MNKFYTLLHILIVAATALLASSCTCKTSVPVLLASQTYVSEAASALGQVEVLLQSSKIVSAADKAKVLDALDKGHKALQAATVAIRLAKDTCEGPDFAAIFADFNEAWGIIRPLIPVIVGLVGSSNDPKPIVADPTVYLMYRKP